MKMEPTDVRGPTVTISDEEVAAARRDGHLLIPDTCPPEELERLHGEYDRIFAERAGWDRGDCFDLAGNESGEGPPALPQILGVRRHIPWLEESRLWANCRAIAARILGIDGVVDCGDHAILKPAGFGARTPWHQDEAYWDPGKLYTRINFWTPLEDATSENGCMSFVPGSHFREVLEHRSIGGDARVHGLELTERAAAEAGLGNAVCVPVPAGWSVIHFPRTLHYAGPNRTGSPRRAYICNFGIPPRPNPEPRRFPWNEVKCAPRQERAARAETGHPDPQERGSTGAGSASAADRSSRGRR